MNHSFPRLLQSFPAPGLPSGSSRLVSPLSLNITDNKFIRLTNTDAKPDSGSKESDIGTSSSTSAARANPRRRFRIPYPVYSWTSPKIQRSFMNDLAVHLGFDKTDISAWYKVSSREIRANGGRELLRKYGDSLFSLLRSVYPEHTWEISKFNKRSKLFWENDNDKRRLVEEILTSLGFSLQDKESWYKVSPGQFIQNGGRALLLHYSSSLSLLFGSLYPDHTWDESKFLTRTRNPWSSVEYQKQFIRELASKLGIKEGDFESYYNFNNMEVIKRGGSGLLYQYNNSIASALMALYPEHPWDVTEFARRPKGYWKSSENQRAAVIEIGRQLGIGEGEYEKWYKVTAADVRKHKGAGLLYLYNNAVSSMLIKVFPEHKWDLFKLQTKPQSYWKSVSNQRSFMDDLGKRFGFKEGDYAAWYKVGIKEMARRGAGGLLFHYGTSISSLLREVYPEHKWDLWRFAKIPKNILNDEKTWNEIFVHVEASRGIKKPEDWAKIATKDLEELGVKYFFDKSGGLLGVLPKRYPEVDWINLLK